MKLESLKSEKFRKLEHEEMNKVNGGLAQLSASSVTGFGTMPEKKTDSVCEDCDE